MTRYILSDIHEDFTALRKVMDLISNDNNHHLVYTLGDIVGFSSHYKLKEEKRNANGCIEVLKMCNTQSVLGNHDLHHLNRKPSLPFFLYPQRWNVLSSIEKKLIDGVWPYKDELSTKLSNDNLLYLDSLQDHLIDGNILFSHFLYPDFNGALKLTKGLINSLLHTHHLFMEINKFNISFVGHLHIEDPVVISSNGRKIVLKVDSPIILDSNVERYTVFCPAIHTFKTEKAKFVSYCDESKILRYHIVDIID